MGHQHLTSDQRCQINTLRCVGKTQKAIAEHVGVSQSTISRELRRNAGQRGYQHKQAHTLASERWSKSHSGPTKMKGPVLEFVEKKLQEKWSPQQISGVLKKQDTPLSYQRIYLHVWANKRAGGTLFQHLRHAGKKYNRKGKGKAGRGCIPNRTDISQRPAIVEKKTRQGDWEGDLIVGAHHQGFLITLVDRKSKYVRIIKIENKNADLTAKAIVKALRGLPPGLLRTITFDNGKEFAMHEYLSKKTGIKCYFATPYHSWERGLNEHTNGLIRQYLPKGTNILEVSTKDVQFIEDALNNRPRKVLGYRTPKEVFMGQKKPQRYAIG